ncbi:germination protein YpeB [Clostridium felsineum]|uniref:Sporulation protein YpeB n=1 Tax=Clostridium felsineum TaxID=36839 RepID=A0A1S8M2D3_9CLOT|nr:germination protein YpeB [Clostridium felsineum]URZ03719.1 Sporulation protein YpeB [Clostridium felsineum]URZ07975.1 Sporulation protein YpeB [Clostridium felsineum]URZ13006.1 Sporulation protein YpeB [Clostridium felsineum]
MKSSTKRITYTLAVAIIVVFSTTYAVLMTLEKTDYKNYLQAEYSKSMYQLIDSVENIESDLSKIPVLGSREQSTLVLGDIYRYSTVANDKLHSMPIAQQELQGTSKFISQLGDFCYVLENKAAKGEELSDSDIAQVERLRNQADGLENQLKTVQSNINLGKVSWGEIRKKVGGALASNNGANISDSFKNIQKQSAQYPALIYDGPFSDNNLEIPPKVNGMKEVSRKDAENVVRKAIGEDRIQNIEIVDSGKSNIPMYTFSVSIKGRDKNASKVRCEITKHGGKLFSLLDNKAVNKSSMDIKKATDIGTNYLNSFGYTNMKSTYFSNYGNVGVISYVYTENGISIYPDMIKLKVSLEDGSIVGVEAKKYLISHVDNRSLPTPKISKEAAQSKVGKRLNISSVNLAVVPTETNTEILTYEFVGNYKGQDFVEYIDAATGYETKILQIRNTPNGKLTM